MAYSPFAKRHTLEWHLYPADPLPAKPGHKKKLCTYPRTDSRYLTGDMADSLPVLVNLVASAMPFRKGIAITCDLHTVINDKKVTDHHAVIPTRNLKDADLSALPAGEKAVLELVALRLLCAVAQPHIYSETVVIAACADGEFTAKGKTVKHPGWKALEDAYRAKMKDAEPKKEGAEKALPELTEGQTLSHPRPDFPGGSQFSGPA